MANNTQQFTKLILYSCQTMTMASQDIQSILRLWQYNELGSQTWPIHTRTHKNQCTNIDMAQSPSNPPDQADRQTGRQTEKQTDRPHQASSLVEGLQIRIRHEGPHNCPTNNRLLPSPLSLSLFLCSTSCPACCSFPLQCLFQ